MGESAKNVCFTGHRAVDLTPALKRRLTLTLKGLIRNGAENIYAGGAVGFDTLCAITVLRLKKQYPNIRLCLVLPCPADEQTAGYSETEKAEYSHILSKADSVEICSACKSKDCMKMRNSRLVELADVCVCYFNERNRRSAARTPHSPNQKRRRTRRSIVWAGGQAQTVLMAFQKGIDIINLRKG